jgi:hypothetical protein
MADYSRFKTRDLIVTSLFESCIYPFQGTVMYRAAGSSQPAVSPEECLLPYSGLLCGNLKTAA